MAIEVIERIREGEKVPTRKRSKQQENYVAKLTGGTCTPNSGATDFGGKGDITLPNGIIECKTKMVSSKSITLKKEWFEKNKQEAVFMGKKFSALAFNFGPNEENFYVINEELFLRLLEVLK